MARILVVEDDVVTADAIVREFHDNGHTTETIHDGAAALARAVEQPFDAITLDRMLPTLDGLALVERLRGNGITTPVLMISALTDVDERIAGLRAGGDDYLTKPFDPAEMMVRIEVLLRRSAAPDTAILRAGAIEIDVIRRSVTVDGIPVRLLHMEFRLLEFLARNLGKTVSRRIIFEQVWRYHFDPGANLINVHVARLRKKLDRPGHPSAISTLKGEGYRLDAV
jgi:two-component system OmpR family response regulator